MLSEVRSLVAVQDQELYDRLVLHREGQAHQAWHGSLGVSHPEAHHNQIIPVILDVGHTIPAVVHTSLRVPENGKSIVTFCVTMDVYFSTLISPYLKIHIQYIKKQGIKEEVIN